VKSSIHSHAALPAPDRSFLTCLTTNGQRRRKKCLSFLFLYHKTSCNHSPQTYKLLSSQTTLSIRTHAPVTHSRPSSKRLVHSLHTYRHIHISSWQEWPVKSASAATAWTAPSSSTGTSTRALRVQRTLTLNKYTLLTPFQYPMTFSATSTVSSSRASPLVGTWPLSGHILRGT